MPSQKSSARHRGYCFTLHDYTDEEVEQLKAMDCKYMVGGFEKCPTTQRPHIQGYVYWENAKAFTACKRKFPNRTHLQVANGTADENYDYCTKTGKHAVEDAEPQTFFEIGTKPLSQKEKGRKGEEWYDEQMDYVKTGQKDKIASSLMLTQSRNIDYLLKKYEAERQGPLKPRRVLENYWFWGEAGTGKSRYAHLRYPGAHVKQCNKWWDKYDNTLPEHKVVIIEEISPVHEVLATHIKQWTDHYVTPVEVKNGGNTVRPEVFVVTSNYHPREIFTKDADLQPILRRFKVIEFKKDNSHKVLVRKAEEYFAAEKAKPDTTAEDDAAFLASFANAK